jgi:hypothetical protein
LKQEQQELIKKSRRLLSEWSWSFYVHLIIPYGPAFWRLGSPERLVDAWISDFRRTEGTSGFRWIKLSKSKFTAIDLYLVIGGVRPRIKYWTAQWARLGGTAAIVTFDPKRNRFLDLLTNIGDRE